MAVGIDDMMGASPIHIVKGVVVLADAERQLIASAVDKVDPDGEVFRVSILPGIVQRCCIGQRGIPH